MAWRQMTGLKPYWSNLTNPFLTCLKTRRPSVILLCRRLHRTTDRACKVLTLEVRMVVAKVLLQVRILLSNRRRPSPSSVQTSGRRSGRDRTRCRPHRAPKPRLAQLRPRVCAARRPRRHIFLDFSSRNSFVLQGRDHVTVLLLSRQSINSCSLTLPLALMISITSAD